MSTSSNRLKDHVLSIINDIENGIPVTQQDIDDGRYDEGQYEAGDILGAWDYIKDALDIEYIVNSAKDYRGASILVALVALTLPSIPKSIRLRLIGGVHLILSLITPMQWS